MCKDCCDWALRSEIERAYHDNEWGKVVKDDNVLFEYIVLESFQAGLSWRTILKRREGMRAAFDGFDPLVLAKYTDSDIDRLMLDDRIIKNKLKIKSLSTNAKAFLRIKDEFKGFYNYIFSFTNGRQIINNWNNAGQIPTKTELSDKIAKDMKKRGFKFLGSTSVYAFLQSIGVVNDHLVYCNKRER